MYYSNIHTHTNYCDGINSAEEMVLEAINLGLKTIGISTHGPLPFKAKWAVADDQIDDYINEVNMLKIKYKGKIEVLLGMEMDYFVDLEYNHVSNELINRLDYWIGSIHYLGRFGDMTPWTVDASYEKFMDGINFSYNGNAKKAIDDYYFYLGEMVRKYEPTVVGHLDLVKKTNRNNMIFNEKDVWYKEAVCSCLDKIQTTKSVVEINTGAIARGFLKEQYPSSWILEEINNREIPITINSDAHSFENLTCSFKQMYELVKIMKIKNVVTLTKDGFKQILL
ncbi:histidinol-phosphatase [Sedimentibacter sp. zth1]|uniref:histidinol-phosphatase n=1 Tax=Sedimentibacter sp. zth1 TaxID=2816908 RepID=UPI001A91116A|nr:histidinol-phosphatase [Sedimentibacter sp. zth1]QSX04924.1 histidinol-phosphatase [Sedimentibacter sp. zth1]